MANVEKQQQELCRIMGTDIKTGYNLLFGLSKIKGVGIMFANAICQSLGLDRNRTIGSLTEKEVEKLEEFFTNPHKKGIPAWLLNQRKDFESGEDVHFVAKDIEFNQLQFNRRFAKLKTYKSLRRRAGVPVRGQRTKSNFRRNRMVASMKKKTGGRK